MDTQQLIQDFLMTWRALTIIDLLRSNSSFLSSKTCMPILMESQLIRKTPMHRDFDAILHRFDYYVKQNIQMAPGPLHNGTN
jgi:hypothetical protein